MQLGYTIIYVKDVPATLEFYEKAFSLTVKFLHESQVYGELETGSHTLAFAAAAFGQQNALPIEAHTQQRANFELAFVTSDVNQAYLHAIAQGAQPIATPQQKPWGQQVAYVKDGNGVLIEICSPLSFAE